MSGKGVTTITTKADKYLKTPRGGVTKSGWNIYDAMTWAALSKYVIFRKKVEANKKTNVGKTYGKLPKVNNLLFDKTTNVKNKLTGRKEPVTRERTVYLPYVPVSWILASAAKLGFSKKEQDLLAEKLNDEKMSVVLTDSNRKPIGWNGKATRHVPIRIGGHLSLLSKQLYESGLDFGFLTNPGADEPPANEYNFEIINEFAFHGDGRLGNKALNANVSEDDSWIRNHPYGAVWIKEKAIIAEANLYFHIKGPTGENVSLDDFHYFNKMAVGNSNWTKSEFEENFVFSNDANPKQLTAEEARTTVDGKKSTVLSALAEALVGAKSLARTTTALADGTNVPTNALYFSLNKESKALELNKLSWKNAEDGPKTGYLLPGFTLKSFTSGKVKLDQNVEVNADGKRELYISLVRQEKIPKAGGKSTTVIDTNYNPNVTLAEVKKVLGPHIMNSESFFRKVEIELPGAIAKSAELRKKKVTTKTNRFLFGATQKLTEDSELSGKSVEPKEKPDSGSEDEESI